MGGYSSGRRDVSRWSSTAGSKDRDRLGSPALGLDVMNMEVLAAADRRDDAADVDAVLDHRVAGLVVAQGDLVTDRDVIPGDDRDVPVLLHDPAGQLLAGLDPLDDDDADAVPVLMDDEMDAHDVPHPARNLALTPAHEIRARPAGRVHDTGRQGGVQSPLAGPGVRRAGSHTGGSS